MATIDTTLSAFIFYTENIISAKIIIHIKCASDYTNINMYSSPADSQHRLSGPGMEIYCKCLQVLQSYCAHGS